MIERPTQQIDNIYFIKDENINKMTGHIYPRGANQLHFTTIVNSTEEKLNSLILDTSNIEEGLILHNQIFENAICIK